MGVEYVPVYDEHGEDVGGYTESVPDTAEKEEPDCYACCDRGCPACGYVDPADPDHLRYLAREIITSRASLLPSLIEPATDAELGAVFMNLPETARATVQELIQAAWVQVSVGWPPPGATELPF